MSFSDNVARMPAERQRTPVHEVPVAAAAFCPAFSEEASRPSQSDNILGGPQQGSATQAASPGETTVGDASGPVQSKRREADRDSQLRLQGGTATALADVCSDNASLRHSAPVPNASSCAASVPSSGNGGVQLSSRIIYPSAPITFIKTAYSLPRWGAYNRHPYGYLNAETVRAAAQADESLLRSNTNAPKETSQQTAGARAGHCGKPDDPCAVQENDKRLSTLVGEDMAAETHATHTPTADRLSVKAVDSEVTFPTVEVPAATSKQHLRATNYERSKDASFQGVSSLPPQPARSRPFMGSWIFGGSEEGTELERLLKEEIDLATSAATRSELAATKLLQEDMEAMIANLQQVKSFLVRKLRECETALLTTAQERDDLESTLQQIQSGIQDSVAEKHRRVQSYQAQLTMKEREVEGLRAELKKMTDEMDTLRRENKTLKGELDVARAEAADVAAAGGFRIEEYQLALRTVVARNKDLAKDLKLLRGQLIRTREDYANALARVDELEALTDFHKTALQEVQAPEPLLTDREPLQSWRIPRLLLQRGNSVPALIGRSKRLSEEARPGSLQRQAETDSRSDRGLESPASASSEADHIPGRTEGWTSGSPAGDAQGGGGSGRANETLRKRSGCLGATAGDVSAGTPRGGSSLGKSVKGLLTSGVSQVLRRLEHAVMTERDAEDPETEEDIRECQRPTGGEGLLEEAFLFVQRTSSSNDLIVHLEEGNELQNAGEGESESRSEAVRQEQTRTLGTVARSMWQAAHELLADQSLPPARLSTLRTVAASQPSGWEVLRERHQAAKSMPLFSSIPPAAYPLIAEGRNERQAISNIDTPGSWRSPSAGSSRVGREGLPLTRLFNTRRPFLARSERCQHKSLPRGSVTLELRADRAASAGATFAGTEPSSDTGDLLAWQRDADMEGSQSPTSCVSTDPMGAPEVQTIPTELEAPRTEKCANEVTEKRVSKTELLSGGCETPVRPDTVPEMES
ncbi:uncharacterized protein LOC34619672 [Cyclospora cayetanensis]|uniref:Uncharacterized protein LOC34619672 n=2 Tax=Cyclospora cayetanensis TaxID=88456 RepID=A0A6P5WDC7_9EIME|nr:uncharacterized protein LOC34619672 [Cyclospora cayetanensis]OEH77367.1 hypothetical protein cyc_02894 [Cyclospora cayetanensis]